MSGVYRPDREGTGALMRSSGIAKHVANVAEDGRRFAEAIAPRQTGEYAERFRVESTEVDLARERRAVAVLANDADHAAAVESKTHVLSRVRDHIESTYG